MKWEFLDELEEELRKHNFDEVDEVVNFFNEMIEDRLANGENEREIIASLGSVKEIVNDVIYGDNAPKNSFEMGIDRAANSLSKAVGDVVKQSLNIATDAIKKATKTIENIDINQTVFTKSYGETDDRNEFDVNEITEMDFTYFSGDIKISQTTESKIIVFGHDIISDNGKLTNRVGLGKSRNSFDLEILIPQKNRLKKVCINTYSGDIDVTKQNINELHADTKSGDVKITNSLFALAQASSISGDVDINNVKGLRIECGSTSGDITCHQLFCQESELKTISGDINVQLIGEESDYKIIKNNKVVRGNNSSNAYANLSTVTGDISCKFTNNI